MQPATLIRLSDSDQTVADAAQDIRGRTVLDRDGDKLGTVDDLLIDSQERKVRFLRVKHGGLLGIGATPSFIPVEAVQPVTDDEEVRVDRSRSQVAGAPAYDPELVDEASFCTDLYGYYGYALYWVPGPRVY